MSYENKYMRLLDEVMRRGDEVEVGQWQSQDVRDDPNMISRELMHVNFRMMIPESRDALQDHMLPQVSLPWAEDHFLERVGGEPLNPPPSEQWWPYARRGNAEHKDGHIFSHTYPERFWPDKAGVRGPGTATFCNVGWNHGIRYGYGDLDDVVKMLVDNPLTRQAYLPIWFPEDTGAIEGQRVPCTLGYHFLCRRGKLDIIYPIRSCDLIRHFTDDVYMAARLCQWVAERLHAAGYHIQPGELVMNISSLHIFKGDYFMVNTRLQAWYDEEDEYGAPV